MFTLLTVLSGIAFMFTIFSGSTTVVWANVAIFATCGLIAEYQSGYFEDK